MDILVAGDLFIDLIMSGFPSWPDPGTEAFAKEFYREIGGGAANTACGLARLGSKAGVLGAIGRDGDWLVERLKSFEVDTSNLFVDPSEPTAVTVAISTAAERSFLTYRGANVRFPDLVRSFATEARHVHLACPADLESIRSFGCPVSVDAGWNENWLDGAMELLPSIDLFFPNHAEAKRMTGESNWRKILEAFAEAGARRVALKLGYAGAALLWDGDMMRVEPISVEVVDTTGAGDCFDAGFLHFWLHGASPMECLRAANICGARSTEAMGGVNGFPSLERVRQELCAR